MSRFRFTKAWVLSLALAGPLLVVPADAVADDAVAEDAKREEATRLADSAFGLFKKKMYADAADLFGKANARHASPVFVLYQAEAEEKLGHRAVAHRLLQKLVLGEPIEPENKAFATARTKAATRLERLDSVMGRIVVEVTGTSSGDLTFRVDSEKVESSGLGIVVEPGEHVVLVERGDGATATKKVSVGEGKSVEVTLAFAVDVASPKDPRDPPDDPSGNGPSLGGPIAILGVGAAGIAVGAIFGAMYLPKADELKERCVGFSGTETRCRPEDEEFGDEVNTLGNVSTVGFVIGAAALAGGAVYLAVELASSDDGDTAAKLNVSPTGLSLEFAF